MGVFGKKKKYNAYDEYHNNNLFDDVDDELDLSGKNKFFGKSAHTVAPRHVLTADEVTGSAAERIPMSKSSKPAETGSVYERLMKKKESEAAFDDSYVPQWVTGFKSVADDTPDEKIKSAVSYSVNTESTVGKAKQNTADNTAILDVDTDVTADKQSQEKAVDPFLERCRIAVENATATERIRRTVVPETIPMQPDTPEDAEVAAIKEEQKKADAQFSDLVDDMDSMVKSLRNEDHPFVGPRQNLISDEGKPEEDEEKTAVSEVMQEPEAVKEPENMAETELGAKPEIVSEREIIHKSELTEPETAFETSKAAEHLETAVDMRPALNVEVEVIPTDSVEHIMNTVSNVSEPEADVRIYGGAAARVADRILGAKEQATDGETILLENLDDIIAEKADSSFKCGRNFDDKYDDYDEDADEREDDDEAPYYECEDESLDGTEDYETLSDSANLRTKYSALRSKYAMLSGLSAFMTILLILLATPVVEFIEAQYVSYINIILFAATVLINAGIFADFKNLVKLKPTFDSAAAVTSVMALVQCVVAVIGKTGNGVVCVATAALMLTVNCFAKRMKASRILTGIERISSSSVKRAVISESEEKGNTIASGAVEGEGLVLLGKRTVNVNGFIRRSSYKSPFELKSAALFFTGIILAVIVGIAAGFLGSASLGLTIATVILCTIYPASAAISSELPMYYASRKAAGFGATLAGYKGAYDLNLANVIAVNTSDLFPAGTVKLYNMKPLGNSDLGTALIDAAAVASAANSPLADIFCKMISEGGKTVLPKVDGVQYEDKMGISGWMSEKTILIGNRNLLQGHNVAVPPIEVDSKILRAGYFPVYLACDGEPSLLLVVKYEAHPDIVTELQRVCDTGMTVVVNSEDPNETGQMLCDYFGLPNDAIRIMNHNGRAMYAAESAENKKVTASASFGENVCGFFSVVSSSIKLQSTFSILTALFVIASVLGGTMAVCLAVFGHFNEFISIALAGYELLFVLIGMIVSKIKCAS